jgi:Fe-S oxidoreductase
MGEAGKRVRKRSIGSVITRIEALKQADPSLGMVYFFEDDFFLRTLEEVTEFSEEWKKRIGVPFFVYGSPVTVDEEKLRLLVEAGLLIVNVGIQTGSERINEGLFGRRMKNSDAIKTAALIRKYVGRGRFGLMPPVYDLIMNNPYETEADIRETISLVRALPKPYLTFMNSLVLFQGTKLHEKAAADGLLSGADSSAGHHYHDTLRHFNNLVKRGGAYYLNSLLFWMSGNRTSWRYGVVPAAALGLLTGKRAVRFFNARPALVGALNRVLPTHKKMERAKLRLEGCFSKD